MVLGAGLFRGPAELPGQIEDVGDQRAAADLVVPDFRVFAVLGAQHAQPFAIRAVHGVVKVAEHHVTCSNRNCARKIYGKFITQQKIVRSSIKEYF